MGVSIDQLEMGYAYETPGKTLTLTDLKFFEEISCWPNGEENLIIPEMLISMISIGLINRSIVLEESLIAVIGSTWSYQQPVKVGDTLKVTYTIRDKRKTKKEGREIAVIQIHAANQHLKGVAQGEWSVLLKEKFS